MRFFVGCGVLLGLLLAFTAPGSAAPEILANYAYVDNQSANPLGISEGLYLSLNVRARDLVYGIPGLTGAGSSETMTSSNVSFPFPNPVSMPLNPRIPAPPMFTKLLPLTGPGQFDSLTGQYTVQVTNTHGESATALTQNVRNLEVLPLPTALIFSDHSLTPTITWTDPETTPDLADLVRKYQVSIFDSTGVQILGSPDLLTPSFSVISGVLSWDQGYTFRVADLDLIDGRLNSRAVTYATFATPEPSSLLLLASSLAGLVGLAWRKN